LTAFTLFQGFPFRIAAADLRPNRPLLPYNNRGVITHVPLQALVYLGKNVFSTPELSGVLQTLSFREITSFATDSG